MLTSSEARPGAPHPSGVVARAFAGRVETHAARIAEEIHADDTGFRSGAGVTGRSLAASDDPLAEDCEALRRALPSVEIQDVDGAWHGVYMHDGVLPQARAVLERFADAMAAWLCAVPDGVDGPGLCIASRPPEAGHDDVVADEKGQAAAGVPGGAGARPRTPTGRRGTLRESGLEEVDERQMVASTRGCAWICKA